MHTLSFLFPVCSISWSCKKSKKALLVQVKGIYPESAALPWIFYSNFMTWAMTKAWWPKRVGFFDCGLPALIKQCFTQFPYHQPFFLFCTDWKKMRAIVCQWWKLHRVWWIQRRILWKGIATIYWISDCDRSCTVYSVLAAWVFEKILQSVTVNKAEIMARTQIYGGLVTCIEGLTLFIQNFYGLV